MNIGPPYDAGAVILAGGSSRRMGTNKCLLPYQGVPLIQHVANQLQPLFPSVTVSTNTPETYEFLGLPMVCDINTGQGPLAGIGATLGRATLPWIFVVAADMPQIPLGLLRSLAQHRAGHRCVVPQKPSGHYEPLFAFYHRSLLCDIERALQGGHFRLQSFLHQIDTAALPIPDAGLSNLNTPADYAASTHSKPTQTNQ